MTGSAIAVLIGSRYPACPAGKTMQLTTQLQDQLGVPIPAASLNTLVLTLVDTQSIDSGTPIIINGVNNTNILNTGRGTVDALGNVVITLGTVPNAADTALVTATDAEETRSAILNWTFNSGSESGGHRIDFLIAALGP